MDTRLLPVQFQLSLNVISFVDRDMTMRYFGGGIGHLKNSPPQQVCGLDPIDPTSESEEMAVEEEDEDLGTVEQPSSDVVNGSELVQLDVNEDDEDGKDDDDDDDDSDSDDSEGGDQTDEDEEPDSESEGEDDYGYASA